MHPDLDLNFITTAVGLTASDQKIDFKIIVTLVSILLRSKLHCTPRISVSISKPIWSIHFIFKAAIESHLIWCLLPRFIGKKFTFFTTVFQCIFFLENRKGVKCRKGIQWIIFRSLCGDHLFSPIAYLIATFIQQTLTQTCVWVSKCIEHKSINCFDSSTSKVR